MDLISILSRTEGKTLEFKRNLSSPDGVLRAIIAFANTSGGIVLIGVEDGSRKVTGVKDALAEEERLASMIADSITPKLVPSLEIIAWRKKQVLAVEVFPSPNRPHHLNRLGPEAGVFVRVGSTNRRADTVLIEEMRRHGQAASFDEQPLPDLNSEAIDFRVASEFFKSIRKLTAPALQSLRVTSNYQGRVVPTIGGLLLFGADRFSRFPDAWVQAGRFRGRDRRNIADTLAIRSPLPGMVEDAIAFLQKHMQLEAVIGPVKRSDRWTLPPVALREALVNAIVHADYAQRGAPIRVALFDDRLEIENPGLLPFGLTLDDLRHGISKLRNHVIGRVFQELGLIEQWGSGIQRMTSACIEQGLAPPRFEEIGTHFRVTLFTGKRTAPVQDEKDRLILALLAEFAKTGLSTAELAARLGLSARATRTRLASLVDRGHVASIGSGPLDPRGRYVLVNTHNKI